MSCGRFSSIGIFCVRFATQNTAISLDPTRCYRRPPGPIAISWSQRLRALAEDRQVGVVGEQAIAPSAREFPGDAQVHPGFEGLAGGGEAQAAQLLEPLCAGERPSAQGRVARSWRACRGASQHHRWLRRQWRRHESPHRFPGGAGHLVAASGLAPHGAPPGRTLNTPPPYSRKWLLP